jgi:secretion/DNA translocation related TadE-like protein
MRRRPTTGDAGAATVIGVALAAVIAVGVFVAGQIARAVVVNHRADTAADFAALAAANALLEFDADPCASAREIAGANEADLLSCSVSYAGAVAVVSVEVRGNQQAWPVQAALASAKAGLRPVRDGPVPAASPS